MRNAPCGTMVLVLGAVLLATTGCFLDPSAGIGEECNQGTYNQDFCKEGLVCSRVDAENPGTPGRCARKGQPGDRCSRNVECDILTAPDGEYIPLVCFDGQCEEQGEEGDLCELFTCAEGLTCNNGYEPPLVCRPLAQPGEICGSASDCGGGPGFSCWQAGFEVRICWERMEPAPGAPCRASIDCPDAYACRLDEGGARRCLEEEPNEP